MLVDTVIVTAASADYFVLVKGLIHSIRDLEAAAGRGQTPIRLIDLGLEPAQIEELSAHCRVLNDPPLLMPIERDDLPRPFLLSRMVKAHMNDYFPGFGTYVWLDADCWVQDLAALDLLCLGAKERGVALVPETDRCYVAEPEKPLTQSLIMERWVSEGFGAKIAGRLKPLPILNSGAAAIRSQSPLWAAWRKRLRKVFQRAPNIVSDQAALMVAIYLDKVPFYPLPAWCNWLCWLADPRIGAPGLTLTEPLAPHRKLGIVHITRSYRSKRITINYRDGATIVTAFDYLSLKQARASRIKA